MGTDFRDALGSSGIKLIAPSEAERSLLSQPLMQHDTEPVARVCAWAGSWLMAYRVYNNKYDAFVCRARRSSVHTLSRGVSSQKPQLQSCHRFVSAR
jgi:hypothetical protein